MYSSLLPTQSTTVISRQLSNIPTHGLLSKCKNNLILLTDQSKSPKKALSWNYKDMSLSKGHLGFRGGGSGGGSGGRGEASKKKLKNTSFISTMTNVTILGVFRMHAQKEYGKVWEMKSTPILNILALLLF